MPFFFLMVKNKKCQSFHRYWALSDETAPQYKMYSWFYFQSLQNTPGAASWRRTGIWRPCGFWPREPELCGHGERGQLVGRGGTAKDRGLLLHDRAPLAARPQSNLTGRTGSTFWQSCKTGLLRRMWVPTCPTRMPLLTHPLTYFANTFSRPRRQRQSSVNEKRPQELQGARCYSNWVQTQTGRRLLIAVRLLFMSQLGVLWVTMLSLTQE